VSRVLSIALLVACGGGAPVPPAPAPAATPEPAASTSGKAEQFATLTRGLADAEHAIGPYVPAEAFESSIAAVTWTALSAEEAAAIDAVLLAPESYVFGANARCRFMPTRAVAYTQDDEEAHILLAGPGCPKIRIHRGEDRLLIDMRREAADVLFPILDAD